MVQFTTDWRRALRRKAAASRSPQTAGSRKRRYLDGLQQGCRFVVVRLGITSPGREEAAVIGAGPELQQGALDLLVLKTLSLGSLHGWAISKRIHEMSRDILSVNQGSLYPALYRLEEKGWVKAEWGISPEGRRARFYKLSAAGRRQLAQEMSSWRLFSTAVNHVLQAT